MPQTELRDGSANETKEKDNMQVEGKNADFVACAYAAFTAADMETLTELFHGREHFFDLYNWDEFWS